MRARAFAVDPMGPELMQKRKLNNGGIIGGLIGLAAVGGLYVLSQANPQTNTQSIRPLLMLVVLGGIIGNKLWSRDEQRSAKSTSEVADEAADSPAHHNRVA